MWDEYLMTQNIAECPDIAAISSRLQRLVASGSAAQPFYLDVLEMQCRLAPASAGAILRAQAARHLEVLAIYPPVAPHAFPPPWLSQAGKQVDRVPLIAV